MKKLSVSTIAFIMTTSLLLAKEPVKPVTAMPVLSKQVAFDRMPASTGEEISAVSEENAKWHVAQVVEQKDIQVKKFDGTVSLVSIYNGGIAMPFEGLLTVFDPTPQNGGDFGTFKTFSLGRTAGQFKLIDSKLYQIKPDEQVLSLAFSSSVWDPNTDKTSVKILRFRVNVHAGEVSSKAETSLKDK